MTALLAVRDLHVAYGKIEAVTGVSLDMQAGQIVTVIGPNGAGKTTLLAALMGKPKLLLLDEPSLGLAPLIVREIFRIVVELRELGVSILLVEQNARAALETADTACVLETGSIVLSGKASDLIHDPRVIASYLGGKVA